MSLYICNMPPRLICKAVIKSLLENVDKLFFHVKNKLENSNSIVH